jgi:hypothetical protein
MEVTLPPLAKALHRTHRKFMIRLIDSQVNMRIFPNPKEKPPCKATTKTSTPQPLPA